MKKIIVLLLALSLLLCLNATVFAMEVDDGSNESTTAGETVSETAVETFIDEDDPAEESAEMETTNSKDESVAPKEDVPTGNPETSQEAKDPQADGSVQPESSGKPDMENEIPGDIPMPMSRNESTYKVTVSWTGLVFTYHPEKKTNWNTKELGYKDTVPAHWTSSDGNDGFGTITVAADESNASSVQVDFQFTASSELGDLKNQVGMKFSSVSGEAAKTLMSPNNRASLPDISPGSTSHMYIAPAVAKTVTTEQIQKVFSDGVKLGTITITLASAWTDPTSPEAPGME